MLESLRSLVGSKSRARRSDINLADANGDTALHLAVAAGRTDIVAYLIANVADVNAGNMLGATPLHVAATHGRIEECRVLIGSGADVNARDGLKCTPLHDAAVTGHLDIIRLLVASGANTEARNLFGDTPSVGAKKSRQYDIAELLLAMASWRRSAIIDMLLNDAVVCARLGLKPALQFTDNYDVEHLIDSAITRHVAHDQSLKQHVERSIGCRIVQLSDQAKDTSRHAM